MRLSTLLFICFLVLVTSSNAQTQQIETVDDLQKQVSVLLREGKLDNVITVAEKIVQLEKKSSEVDLTRYTQALMNLGLWRKQRIALLLQTKTSTLRKILATINEETEIVKSIFTEVIELHETVIEEPLQLATAQSELAALKYLVPQSRDDLIDSERLFLSAIALREKHLGKTNDSVIFARYRLADLYFHTADFEKFAPFARALIASAEESYGGNDRRLLPILRLYAEFLVSVNLNWKVIEITNQITAITGRTEPPPSLNDIALNRLVKFGKDRSSVGPTRSGPSTGFGYSYNLYSTGERPIYDRDWRGNTQRGIATQPLPSNSQGQTAMPPNLIGGRSNRNSGVQFLKVDIIIDKNGKVSSATIIEDDKKYTKQVLKVLKDWEFKPFLNGTESDSMRAVVFVGIFI